MKKYIIDFIVKLESFKSSIKELHWSANSLPQHELCDDIADLISDYQDKIAEVEQSISGKFPLNILKGEHQKNENLKAFVESVISATNSFYSKLKNEGDEYIGMRSDTDAFLGDMQRKLYLVNFTLKEELKERLRNRINENRITIYNGNEQFSLTENELRELIDEAIENVYARIDINESKSKIHIKPENRGKFTATKERTGKSTEELAHSKNPITRKRAIFSMNAKKWNKK